MKVAILAGGRGTRLTAGNVVTPKPMVEIGGRPMLLHVMGMFAKFGHRDFYLALGHHGDQIRNYFCGHQNDWRVNLLDTGLATQTGGRVRQVLAEIGRETLYLTYSDGVADLNLDELVKFHRSHGRLATVTAVHPPARFSNLNRFGVLTIADDGAVTLFAEKDGSGAWINGGFFVFEPGVCEYLEGDDFVLERQTMARLAADRQLMAYRHEGFWQCMDTTRELEYLDALWNEGHAPWA